MQHFKKLLLALCLSGAMALTGCTSEKHDDANDPPQEGEYKTGEFGDPNNNLNKGGEYNPDNRTDNPETHSPDTTQGVIQSNRHQNSEDNVEDEKNTRTP